MRPKVGKKNIKSNLRRCPLLHVTKKICKYDKDGRLESEEIITEFNDCYKSFCMAWDVENEGCKLYPDFDIVDSDVSDEDNE